ncbi:MAG: tail-specific protease [Bacteroidetes bacterium]|nr:MAG: tail-specific protease [Bacteroidota bacterium]
MYKTISRVFLSIILIVCSSYKIEENPEKGKVLIDLIMQGLNMSHFDPAVINDEFSKSVYDEYLKRLDFNKKFFSSEDINQLKKYEQDIDEQLNGGIYVFFDLSIELLNNRIDESQAYYKEILSKPFDFSIDEEIELSGKKLEYASNGTLKERWRKSLKFQTLSRLYDQTVIQEEAKEKNDTTIEIKTFEVLEQESREKILKRHDEWFDRMAKLELSDRRSTYLNTISNAFDPHTSYFAPRAKENFDISMSGRLEGIGASLQQKGPYIKVARIVPGSACWKQGDLEADDIILKVAQGDEEPVDIVDMRLDDAVKLIRGPKGTEVRLTVKKIDETVKVIPIVRDIVILEEIYAKSAVLVDSVNNIENIGYIKLPKFYIDLNKSGGQSCSQDIRLALGKLKQEGINGIILDLRNNGGGSLADVVKIAGLFIEDGPIVQVKSRFGAPQVLKDKDKDIVYDGPLVVMVNSFSASASEIMAAAMQDYQRGIVIGSKSTFGKGTVQRFFNLDNFLKGDAEHIKPLGTVKLTTQKFYRINGGATQLKGVESDIVLPDRYSFIETGEKEYESAMTWDEIVPLEYDVLSKYKNRIEMAQRNSLKRVQSDSTFILIKENADRLKIRREQTIHSLNFEEYKRAQKEIKNEAKKFKNLRRELNGFGVKSLKLDLSELKTDTAKSARINAWHDNIRKDKYVYEAVSVIKDLM